MVKKEFSYRGKSLEELQSLDLSEFAKLIPARERRSLVRGLTEQEKIFLNQITIKDNVKTHCRDMIILPVMVGKKIQIYSGKAFEQVLIVPEMLGHRLGEFSQTRKSVGHNAPGIGATKSSAHVGVK